MRKMVSGVTKLQGHLAQAVQPRTLPLQTEQAQVFLRLLICLNRKQENGGVMCASL